MFACHGVSDERPSLSAILWHPWYDWTFIILKIWYAAFALAPRIQHSLSIWSHRPENNFQPIHRGVRINQGPEDPDFWPTTRTGFNNFLVNQWCNPDKFGEAEIVLEPLGCLIYKIRLQRELGNDLEILGTLGQSGTESQQKIRIISHKFPDPWARGTGVYTVCKSIKLKIAV